MQKVDLEIETKCVFILGPIRSDSNIELCCRSSVSKCNIPQFRIRTRRNLLGQGDCLHNSIVSFLDWALDGRVGITTVKTLQDTKKENIAGYSRLFTYVKPLLKKFDKPEFYSYIGVGALLTYARQVQRQAQHPVAHSSSTHTSSVSFT